MKKLFLLLLISVLSVSASAGLIIQAQETTATKISGGDVYTASSLYSGGTPYNTPSGELAYIQSLGQSDVSEYEYFINTIIPNGTYTVDITWGTQNYNGSMMGMNIQATQDAIDNGRISFAGGSGEEYHTGFPVDNGWLTEAIIGESNWFSGIYFDRVPYSSVTINNVQAGDLSLIMWDASPGSYDRVAWDTLEFTAIPEPATLTILTLGSLSVFRRKRLN